MNGRYLLDTNIVIALFDNEPTVTEGFKKAQEILVPSIVIGELYYGAQGSAKVKKNVTRVDNFVAANTILVCDSKTSATYGIVKNALKKKGRPIPDNDIWIAAITLQHSLTLITRDAHFNEVDGLQIEVW